MEKIFFLLFCQACFTLYTGLSTEIPDHYGREIHIEVNYSKPIMCKALYQRNQGVGIKVHPVGVSLYSAICLSKSSLQRCLSCYALEKLSSLDHTTWLLFVLWLPTPLVQCWWESSKGVTLVFTAMGFNWVSL